LAQVDSFQVDSLGVGHPLQVDPLEVDHVRVGQGDWYPHRGLLVFRHRVNHLYVAAEWQSGPNLSPTRSVRVPAPLTFAIGAGKIVDIARTALTTACELPRTECCISAPASRQFTFPPLFRAPATIFKSANFRWKTRLQLDFHKRPMSGASSFYFGSFGAGGDAIVGE